MVVERGHNQRGRELAKGFEWVFGQMAVTLFFGFVLIYCSNHENGQLMVHESG